jgi:hypothetical protein
MAPQNLTPDVLANSVNVEDQLPSSACICPSVAAVTELQTDKAGTFMFYMLTGLNILICQ